MDATKKIKTWKVALSHLILSFLILVATMTNFGGLFELFRSILICLQPIFALVVKAVASKNNYLFVDQNTMSSSAFADIISFLSFPAWSLFFGWLLANIFNRLKSHSNRQS